MTTVKYERPDLLVETEWLEDNLDDPNIRIVDCDEFNLFRRAHVKNAIGIPVHHYIKEKNYSLDARKHPLVAPPEVFSDLMCNMGIGNDNLVIAYDNSGSLYATRFWWDLNYYGHSNVRVLNGGWSKWFDEGRPASIQIPTTERTTFTPKENPNLVCSIDYGISQVNDSQSVFLDVRSDEEWNGTNTRGNRRSGHIPGAIHLEWLNFLDRDNYNIFKPASELYSVLREKGVTPERQIITY